VAYSFFYFLTLICIVEFVVDIYRNPPDWVQCLFQLRLIAIVLFAIVLVTLVFKPNLVWAVLRGSGIRLLGNAVAPAAVICPIIAIISAYSFLHFLEPRLRALLFFFVGLAGTLTTQVRGSEIALFLSLLLVAVGWARTSRRSMYLFISALMAFILLSSVVVAAVGTERIVKVFERGESIENVEGLSGRTEVWTFVFKYCMSHPQGMGYEAGFRMLFEQHFLLGSGLQVQSIGTAHNTFLDILAGAGWLALAIYLIMMTKIIRLAWRFAKKQTYSIPVFDSVSLHGIRCSLVLLIFCFVYGMDATEFSFPLRAGFYFLYVIVAMILGLSATMLVASRAEYELAAS
jgi:O-antigen ligase